MGCADVISAMPSATKKVEKLTTIQPTLTTPGPPVVRPYWTARGQLSVFTSEIERGEHKVETPVMTDLEPSVRAAIVGMGGVR